jgi:hypothetical protein
VGNASWVPAPSGLQPQEKIFSESGRFVCMASESSVATNIQCLDGRSSTRRLKTLTRTKYFLGHNNMALVSVFKLELWRKVIRILKKSLGCAALETVSVLPTRRPSSSEL